MGELDELAGRYLWDVAVNGRWHFQVMAHEAGTACETAGMKWGGQDDLTDEQRAEGVFQIEARRQR